MLCKHPFRIVATIAASVWCVATSAQEKRFGAWTVGVMTENEGVFAATINDSKGLLGQYCYRQEASCIWILANDVDCEDGSKYPVLVNSDTGAMSTTLLCAKLNGKPRYAFMEFDAVDNIVRHSEWFGIAFPMKSGFFQVSRFPLNGAGPAVTFMRKVSESLIDPAKTGTADRKL